ncbi:T9SS type A sorting domain-containing protein [Salibacteraceae bacterium]|nr:T9SS type A sorting domain-containing protein [Salibacteraceae bacterium]
MKKVSLILFNILIACSAYSQDVNSISTIPTNPDNTDFVKVVVNTTMNTSDCWINTSSVTTTGYNHSIIGAHCSGIAQQICTKSDTYNLGVLAVGNHSVSYDMFYGNLSSGQTQCSSYILGDSLSTSFNVSNAGGNLPVEIHPQGSHNICDRDSFYILTDEFGQAIYKWLLNGDEIYSGSNAFIWAKDSGLYQVKVFVNGDSGTSAGVLVNANSAPSDVLAQEEYSIKTDYLSNTYQWYKIGSGLIVGADSHEYEVTQNGEYYVELISSFQCVGYSDTLYVEMIDATIEPADSTIGCSSDSFLLSAVPSGSQYSYQWYRDGLAITGAIQSTFTPFLSGFYKVGVSISQSYDTSESHYAMLYPGPSPIINFDGANLFSTPAASYQWYQSGSGPINGATDSLFTPIETGLYFVKVKDSFGCSGQSAGYAITTVGIDVFNHLSFTVIQQNDWLYFSRENAEAIPFRIIDLTGQQVYEGLINDGNSSVNISQWSSGIYFIQTLGNKPFTTKVIIL